MPKRPVNLNKAIGKKLKYARERRGYSQQQLADQAHFNQCSISNIEAGRRRISVENLITFSKILKVSPLYFLSDFEKDG